MKKAFYTVAFLFGSMFFIAMSPSSNKENDYIDLSADENKVLFFDAIETATFVQSETSHETADRLVWNKRHKTWTDVFNKDGISIISEVVSRN